MAQKEFNYQQSERILCYHGPKIYEAKILEADSKHPKTGILGPHYLIHYKGWKNTWDEWVSEDRVLKFNEANLAKQKTLEKTVEEGNRKGRSTIKKPVQDTIPGKGKKRRRDTLTDKDENIKKPKISIAVPDPLRVILVQDWENINKSSLFVPLPRKPSVIDIINQYKTYRSKTKGDQETSDGIADEVIDGVQFYFNKYLGSRLLYQTERQQYQKIRNKNEHSDNTQIYGAEHLLRLFVSFPQLISKISLAEDTLEILKYHLGDFLNFLNDHRKEYFIDEYQKIKD